jgi:hypothetical protein
MQAPVKLEGMKSLTATGWQANRDAACSWLNKTTAVISSALLVVLTGAAFYLSVREPAFACWCPGLLGAWDAVLLVFAAHWYALMRRQQGRQPGKGYLLALLPAAPWLATCVVSQLSRGLLAADDLVLEMFPNSVQIMHSAVYLADRYNTLLAAAIAVGVIVLADRLLLRRA